MATRSPLSYYVPMERATLGHVTHLKHTRPNRCGAASSKSGSDSTCRANTCTQGQRGLGAAARVWLRPGSDGSVGTWDVGRNVGQHRCKWVQLLTQG